MNETDEIKARLPLEQLIGRYVPLKRAGRIYKGLCPFHNERTPSFSVNPERGIYKCFGCGEGGDHFAFIMKTEGVTFPEALQLLADQTGVTLPERSRQKVDPGAPSKTRLFELNGFIAQQWHALLLSHASATTARDYLRSRGLTNETIAAFSIGIAPSVEGTRGLLQRAGYSSAEINTAGDPTRFHHRITFPICDITGRVVAFTGRILEGDGPKYYNTSETPVFSKSRTVYALHLAKESIRTKDVALLAEGQMDVVTLHQHGYTNAVASSGTALTKEQLQMIGRFTSTIVFAYDADSAGQAATEKGAQLCLEIGLTPWVVIPPEGKDPADALNADPAAWANAYEARLPFLRWLIDRDIAAEPLTPERKRVIAGHILPWLQRITNTVEQHEWIRILAGRLQTDEALLQRALGQGEAQPAPAKQVAQQVVHSLTAKAIALLISFPRLYEIAPELNLTVLTDSTEPLVQAVLSELPLVPSGTFQEQVRPEVLEPFSGEIEAIMEGYNAAGMGEPEAMAELLAILRRLRSNAREDTKTQIARAIADAQTQGDIEGMKRLMQELMQH